MLTTAGVIWRTSGANVGTEPPVLTSGIWPAAGQVADSASKKRLIENERIRTIFVTSVFA
jgi:hypothetical protein